jgi:hypothetical protein
MVKVAPLINLFGLALRWQVLGLGVLAIPYKA